MKIIKQRRASSRWSFNNLFREEDDSTVVPSFGKDTHLAERVFVLEQRRASKAQYWGSSFEDDLKQPVVLRLFVAKEIKRGDQPGMFSTNDGLVLLVEGDAEVVSVDGNQELRLTFPANSGPVEAAIEYRW